MEARNGIILLGLNLVLHFGACHEAAAQPVQLQSEQPQLAEPPVAPDRIPQSSSGVTSGAPVGGYGPPSQQNQGGVTSGAPGYGAQTQGRPYASSPYQDQTPYQGQQPSYNTGIQYGEQYPSLQAPAGYSGGAYGGGYAGGAQGYQDSYHVPPSFYQGGGGMQPPPGPGQIYSDRQVFVPAGTVLPVSLQTAISTQVAKPGDYIQATISQNVSLGGRGYIPAGTQVVGTVSDSEAGRRLSRSGELSLQFNSLRLPSGQQIPITAHLQGSLGKYANKGTGTNDVYRGEGWGAKLGQTAIRGGLGAGLGAGLGTAVGAIAGGGHGAGMGAWSGAAIGGGIGLADMFLRKGRDVIVPAGTNIEIQLDQPADLGGGGPPPVYRGQPGYPGQSYSGTF